MLIKRAVVLALVPAGSMLPLLLKDGLLAPYAVTSLAFLFFSVYLLSPLETCSEDELRLGAYHKLLFCLPRLDLARIVRWTVSGAAAWSNNQHRFNDTCVATRLSQSRLYCHFFHLRKYTENLKVVLSCPT